MAIFTRGKVGPWPTSQRWVQHGPSASFSSFAPSSSVPTASRPPRGVLRCSAGAGCVASWLVVVYQRLQELNQLHSELQNPICSMVLEYVPTCLNVGKHSLLGLLKPPKKTMKGHRNLHIYDHSIGWIGLSSSEESPSAMTYCSFMLNPVGIY